MVLESAVSDGFVCRRRFLKIDADWFGLRDGLFKAGE
jgi:hypothetical protein